MKKILKATILTILLLILLFPLHINAQEVNLDTLVINKNYKDVTKLVITSNKNLSKLKSLDMPNLTQVEIANVNIPDSSYLSFNKRINILYIRDSVINLDNLNDTNIQKVEIRRSYIYGNTTKSKNYLKNSKHPVNYTKDERYDYEINEIAKSIYRNGMSDEEIIKAVTNYVISHIKYTTSTAYDNKSYMENILNGQGVCSHYAYLESQLLNKLGVYTLFICGYTTESSAYHAWNVVYLNNNWYILDPTWLDANDRNVLNESSSVYKKFYLKPINYSVYKPQFVQYNNIPQSERKATSTIKYNNTTTNKPTNTTNNNVNNKPNTTTNKPTNTTNSNVNNKPNTTTNNYNNTNKPSNTTNNNVNKPSINTNNTTNEKPTNNTTNNYTTNTNINTNSNNNLTNDDELEIIDIDNEITTEESENENEDLNNEIDNIENSNDIENDEIENNNDNNNNNNNNNNNDNDNNNEENNEVIDETDNNINNTTNTENTPEIVDIPNTGINSSIPIIIGIILLSVAYLYISKEKRI